MPHTMSTNSLSSSVEEEPNTFSQSLGNSSLAASSSDFRFNVLELTSIKMAEKLLDKDESCSICLEHLLIDLKNQPIVAMHDQHFFHVDCIKPCIPESMQAYNCPLCREEVLNPKTLYNQACVSFNNLLEGERGTNGFWQASNEQQQQEISTIIKKWTTAAQLGNSRSQFILGKVFSFGTGVIADLNTAIGWYELSGEQGCDAALAIGDMFYAGCTATPKDFVKATEWYKKAADKGSDKAMKMLGNIYSNGEGIEVDYGAAYYWYLKSAELGNGEAQFKLANMFYQGQHVAVDYPRAFLWCENAAKQKISQAMLMMGLMYFRGKGVEVNYPKAIECLEEASEQGNHKAQYKLGEMYFFGSGVEQDYKKAFDYLEKAASKQYDHAELLLGIMCYCGNGTTKSYQEAARWYKLAADKNNVLALLKLGALYYSGRGMPKDYGQAIHYYELAAKLNNHDAYFLLANMHYNGKGVPKNVVKAVALYKKSAEQNHAGAQNMLGNISLTGEGGTSQSYEDAFNWFLKSASKGHLQATISVANMFFHGQYNGQNLIEAKKWYIKAAKKNSEYAQLSLGHLNMMERSYTEAIKWYSLAAKHRNRDAEFNLGFLYSNVQGVEKNLEEAAEHFEKAAYRGHIRACFYLGNILFNLGTPEKSVKWYYRASLGGDKDAQLKLGEMFQKGEGVEEDLELSKEYFNMCKVDKATNTSVQEICGNNETASANERSNVTDNKKRDASELAGVSVAVSATATAPPLSPMVAEAQTLSGISRRSYFFRPRDQRGDSSCESEIRKVRKC